MACPFLRFYQLPILLIFSQIILHDIENLCYNYLIADNIRSKIECSSLSTIQGKEY